uniref:Uncharacterized protein n=1 Tax=Globisporangium ultimum (strain ATCC 200006 / CBS 805.95 / DAOM BR144) TaxID=431595 RepID=K3WJD2_GLOUD
MHIDYSRQPFHILLTTPQGTLAYLPEKHSSTETYSFACSKRICKIQPLTLLTSAGSRGTSGVLMMTQFLQLSEEPTTKDA